MTFNPVGIRSDIPLQNNRVELRFTFKGQTYLCAFIGICLLLGASALVHLTTECRTHSKICWSIYHGSPGLGLVGGIGIYLGLWGMIVGGGEPLYYFTRP